MELTGRVEHGVVVLPKGVSLPEGAFVAVVYPSPAVRQASEWSDALNDRRIELIDKDIEQTITPEERVELAELQQRAVAFRDQAAPLPIEGARQLHHKLLEAQHGHEGRA